jgi:AcrR family transcriptional regulator
MSNTFYMTYFTTMSPDRWLTDVIMRHTHAMKKVVDAANSLRERKKARTREAIIDAALDLFERNGYDDTTIEEIADAADVSPRTFFRYFDSKLELIMVRSDSKHDDLGPALAARPPDEGLLEAIRQVMKTQLDTQLADPLVLRELQVMLSTPSLRTMAREHFYDEEAGLARAVAGRLGLAEDNLSVHVISGIIASALWATVNRWVAEGAGLDQLWPMLDEAFGILAGGLADVPASAVRPS